MSRISEIYEGWKNHLFPPSYLKETIERVSGERLAICEHCEKNSKFHSSMRPDEHCTECGCTLGAKTACLSCECPLSPPKWKSVVSYNEETEMTNENK